jgi:rhodanese-related sulfurtransferase
MAVQRISVNEVKRLLDAGQPLTLIDARSPDAWAKSDVQLPGSIRVPPDEVLDRVGQIPRDRLVITYCT